MTTDKTSTRFSDTSQKVSWDCGASRMTEGMSWGGVEGFVLKPGVWKFVRNTGPRKGELVQRIEASVTLKSVDRRFVAQEFSHDAGVEYSVMTYDYETESYRWWASGQPVEAQEEE